MLVQFAPHTSYSDSVFAKVKPLRFEFCFRFEHSISGFLCPTRFGNHNDERLRKVLVDSVEDAIEAVWVGVIEKVDIHWISG